jgi:hypothetical protein
MDVEEVDMKERLWVRMTEYSVLNKVLKEHECEWS